MSIVVFWVALCALVGCFVTFAVASYRHFRDEASAAHLFLRVVTLGFSAGFVLLAIWKEPAGHEWSLGAILFACLSYGLFTLARRATHPGEFHVAFGGDGPERLTTHGIYRHCRNPFYAAYMIYWVAWAVLLGVHWAGLVGIAVFAFLYGAAIRQEERFLAERFGDDYLDYCSRSGRFFPRELR